VQAHLRRIGISDNGELAAFEAETSQSVPENLHKKCSILKGDGGSVGHVIERSGRTAAIDIVPHNDSFIVTSIIHQEVNSGEVARTVLKIAIPGMRMTQKNRSSQMKKMVQLDFRR
jgi:hypothetical protein